MIKKILYMVAFAATLGAVTAPASAQNVQFHGNVINGHWYQNNDTREWTTYLVGMYHFTNQKTTWAYDITREYDSSTSTMTFSSANIETLNPALYGGQGAVRVGDFFYTFYGREAENENDPGNIGGEYGSETMEVVARKWNINTWEKVDEQVFSVNRGLNFTDLTYDPLTDEVYCIYSDISGSGQDALNNYYLGTLDLETMTVTRISKRSPDCDFRALAAHPNGNLYALAYGGRQVGDTSFPASLYIIDKNTGEYTKVGDLGHGIPRSKLQSMVADFSTGKLYHAGNMYNSDVEKSTSSKSTKDTGLYEIDITTGQATLLSKFPYKESIVGLWIEGDIVKKNYDLNVKMQAPAQFTANTPGTVFAKVKNLGVNEATGYTVNLYVNGRVAASVEGNALAAGAAQTYMLDYTATAGDGSSVNIYVTVDYAADENIINNTSAAADVRVSNLALPTVSLMGMLMSGTTALAWEAPQLGTPVKEDFESYAPFIISGIGGWTTQQLGGKEATAVINSPLYGQLTYPNAGAPFAYQVFNPAESGLDAYYYEDETCSFYCQSGSQMLLSMVGAKRANNTEGYENVISNDWLISPELSGKAQTISFYAKCWTSQVAYQGMYRHYVELFNVLYSTTDTNPESFIQLGETNRAAMWFSDGAFVFDLPEGAKYFAIQCVSDPNGTTPVPTDETEYDFMNNDNEGWMFFVDDITYTPASPHLLGYNVYKNGVKMNTELLTDVEYFDAEGQGYYNNVYGVSAVYEEGESPVSNLYTVIGTGINGIDAARTAQPGGFYTLTGKYVGRVKPAKSGVYVVRKSGSSQKVIIK